MCRATARSMGDDRLGNGGTRQGRLGMKVVVRKIGQNHFIKIRI